MSRKMSKKMDKEICHDNMSYLTTQRIEYRRDATKDSVSRQKMEECNKSAETKKVNVATRFVN